MKITRSLLLGVTLLVILLGGTAFAFASVSIGGTPSHAMQITFPSADGLVAGSDVLEAGAKIGYIESSRPTRSNSALVTLEIDGSHWPLHQGLTADIRPKSLLGEKYVDLHDGPPNAPAYDAARVLHANQNADPVELDQFINSLDPSTRTAVRVLLDDLGGGIAGRGEDLNAAIASGKADLANFAVTGRTLDNRDADLDKILVGLDAVLSKITTSDQLTQMSQLIANGQNTLNDIEQVRTSFSKQFTDANTALTELNSAFDGAVPSLHATIDIGATLIANLQKETAALTSLGRGVLNGRDTVGTGSSEGALTALEQGLLRGPYVLGGALDPSGNPITRVCLIFPVPGSNSCDGTGPRTTSLSVPDGFYGAGSAATFAAFLGA